MWKIKKGTLFPNLNGLRSDTNEYISSNYRSLSNLFTCNVGHVKLVKAKSQMINLTN